MQRRRGGSDEPQRFPGVWLLAAFATVALSFLGSTYWSLRAARDVDALAARIAFDHQPGILRVAEIRNLVRQISGRMDDYALASSARRRELGPEIERSRADIRRELEEYLSLPIDKQERLLWLGADHALQLVEARIGQLIDPTALRERSTDPALRSATDQFVDALFAVLKHNEHESRADALRIEQARKRAERYSAILDSFSVALAILVALLLVRALRVHTHFLEAYGRLAKERADELEQFAGRLAHDISSPLAATGLALEMTSRHCGNDPAATRVAERGKASLVRVRVILDGLLEFARSGAQPEPGARASVREAVTEVIEENAPMAGDRGIDLGAGPIPALFVACNEGLLLSLLQNLIRNAIKYMGEGAEKRIRILVALRDRFCRFEIEDTGPGVPPGLEKMIFEPYGRAPGTAQPGIGLGLATVRRIVESHGGTVGVRSAPGRGSVFWFELPKARTTPPSADPPSKEQAVPETTLH